MDLRPHRGWLALTAAASAAVLLVGGPAASGAPANALGSSGGGEPYYPTDGNGGIDVLGYDITLRYAPDTHQLTARTVVTARATESLRRFNLDLNGLTVTGVAVDGSAASFTREGDHELVITPRHALRRGDTFSTSIRYEGVPQPLPHPLLGQSGWQYTTTGGAFAAGAPHTATTWFPANDIPTDKATLRVTASVPDGWGVVSNGREAGTTSGGGWTTYRWSQQRPMSTYLSLIAIDRWTIERDRLRDGTPVVNAYAPGALEKKALQDRVPEILEFLSTKFGPYPQVAAGGVFLADPIPFSMETVTRPIYAVYADLSFLVHENTHQWFGDSVTVREWRDVCISECFASYAPWLWDEAKDGVDLDARYREQVTQFSAFPGFWSGTLYDMGPYQEFAYPVYLRGPLALHALRHQIGEPAFDALLRAWPARHRYGNAGWLEFEALASTISGQDLRGFFDAWVRGTDVPPAQYLWPGTLTP